MLVTVVVGVATTVPLTRSSTRLLLAAAAVGVVVALDEVVVTVGMVGVLAAAAVIESKSCHGLVPMVLV